MSVPHCYSQSATASRIIAIACVLASARLAMPASAQGVGGGYPSSAAAPTFIRSPPVTYTAIPTTTIPIGTAVQEASSITTGCDIQNVGTVPLYFSNTGAATAASQQLQPGQAWHCPFPTSQPLSVYNASGTTTGTLAGDTY